MSEAARSPAALISRTCWIGGLISGEPVVEQAAVADNGGEQVVEVVSDTAGQSSDGLHFLRLPKMILDFTQGLLRPVCAR